ncbi:hypothetical protein P7C73_g1831, partial [Tremellales sp. Uapishka_1]
MESRISVAFPGISSQHRLLYHRHVPSASTLFYLELPQYVPCGGAMVGGKHCRGIHQSALGGLSLCGKYVKNLSCLTDLILVDCYNGEHEPIVHHGKTLTRSVPVRDICKAINKYAFVASPYPIIISAEMHCDLSQQERLVLVFQEVFGERLVTEPIAVSGLPSPDDLKGRILFKVSLMERIFSDYQAKAPSLRREPNSESPPESTDSTGSDSGFIRLARRLSITGPERQAFAPSLAKLLVYTAGVKYQGFSKLVHYEPRHQFSVSERTADRILRENKVDWIKHNFTHISRIYPKATRLASSNYDPVPYWAAGCQLVALNWQTIGELWMRIDLTADAGATRNLAMFHDSGYVLKPLALRQKVQENSMLYRITIEVSFPELKNANARSFRHNAYPFSQIYMLRQI